MRVLAWLMLALLAADAAAAAVAKPPAERGAADAMVAQMAAAAACVSAQRDADLRDAFVLRDCQCAVDRFVAEQGAEALASLDDAFAKPLDAPFAACRAERSAAAGTANGDEPAASRDPAKDPSNDTDLDLLGWVRGLDLPVWAWVLIPGLAVLLLIMLRRRDPRGDIIAPPRGRRGPGRPGDPMS